MTELLYREENFQRPGSCFHLGDHPGWPSVLCRQGVEEVRGEFQEKDEAIQAEVVQGSDDVLRDALRQVGEER